MSPSHRRPVRWRPALAALLAAPAWMVLPPAAAQPAAAAVPAPAAASAPAGNSALDGQLLYQLLVGEIALTSGNAGTAYEWILDAARRTRDEKLFRRAVDIALQARAGEQALAATRAWRLAQPESLDALRLQLQILLLLNRNDDIAEPLQALLALTPPSDRPGLIAALPRFLQRTSDPRLMAGVLESALEPYRSEPSTRVTARVAAGRVWLEAREPDRAWALAQEAHALDPTAPGPVLLAMELVRETPAAETLVLKYLGQPQAEPALRLGYVRLLTSTQRYADAVAQLEEATRRQPEVAPPYLSLGALHLELKHPKEGEAALERYVELVQRQSAARAAAAASASDANVTRREEEESEEEGQAQPSQGLVQAWLMLAQSAEQRGDFQAAEAWLAKVDDPRRALEVQTRRASILARQGQLEKARELIRLAPERSAEDLRAKFVAEATVLREVKHWREAFDVLGQANERFPDDTGLMYEQAMMAEKIDRLDEMERLLRRVIELKPDDAHAHNALGYSLADRSQRLPEARVLIQRALELSPGDPFITDSLGWVEFRLGNAEEALRLLRRAYAARPDPEIAAHLGEVLWALDQRDEARRIWLEAKGRDATNDVLRETLARLRVDL